MEGNGSKVGLMGPHGKDGVFPSYLGTPEESLMCCPFLLGKGFSGRKGFMYAFSLNMAMRKNCHVHFTDEQTEAEVMMYPRSHKW